MVGTMERGTCRRIGQRRRSAGMPAADPTVGAVVVDTTLARRTRVLLMQTGAVDSTVAVRTAVVVRTVADRMAVDRTADAAKDG